MFYLTFDNSLNTNLGKQITYPIFVDKFLIYFPLSVCLFFRNWKIGLLAKESDIA